jgi:DNA polymerase elongation subunit (family B)
MRKYTQNGYTVSYYPAITEKNEQFKGAYTYTNPDFVCKVTKDVLCLDFVSLYPHAMISANACLTTYLSESKEGCNTVDLIDIHPDDTHTSSG